MRAGGRDLLWVAVFVPFCLGLGVLSATAFDDQGILTADRTGVVLVALLAGGALFAFHATNRSTTSLGPGVLLAALAFGAAFALGLSSGDYRIIEHEDTVSLYFAVGLVAFLAGAIGARLLAPTKHYVWPPRSSFDPLARPGVRAAAVVIVAMAASNMATGSIPLLSANVDEVRFNSDDGVFAPIFTYLIGGLQWVVLLIGVTWIMCKRKQHRVLFAAALLLLVLIASRSLLLALALSGALAVAALGRLSLARLIVLALGGLLLLGAAGLARVGNSDPTGERRAFLATHGYNGVTGIIAQSATSSPYVFGQTLDAIPERIPFQHGTFLLRDFRSQIPGHFLGRPIRSDGWITTDILGKRLEDIGGSPPTLVGGFYIDFGVPGIVIGCALLGAFLTLLFDWTRSAGTIGALTLYSYVSAWVVLSAYNFISLRPITLAVAVLAYLAHRGELRSRRAS